MAAPTITKFLNLLPARLIFPTLLLSLSASGADTASDTLSNGGNITDGATLVSANRSFTLGFFFPAGVPTKRYLGIWLTTSPDAVCWVANRDTPLNDASGVLEISSPGAGGSLLRLLDGSGRTAWSSNTMGSSASAVAQLLEDGNLVVREQRTVLWQSFDHPSNAMVVGMKFGKNLKTGFEWSLTSWRAKNDPATGAYRRAMDTKGLPDVVIWHGNAKKSRAGPWNGRWFSGVPDMASDKKLFAVEMVDNRDEIAYVLNSTTTAYVPRVILLLDEAGVMQVLVWISRTTAPTKFAWSPKDPCDDYAKCGAFGVCSAGAESPINCSCVEGFRPASPSQWSMGNYSGGCRRDARLELECGNGRAATDRFVDLRGVKLPDTENATVDMGATLEECRARCLADCSCVAYAAANIRGGGVPSGCVMWPHDIVDVRYVDNGKDLLYVRVANSVQKKRNMVLVILLPVAACLLALTGIFLLCIYCKLRGKRRDKDAQKQMMLGYLAESNTLGDEDFDLPFFSFGEIVSATNNFAQDNMLGQGGFGKVYKGMLGENKEVAIKRLSQGSRQGVDEFRNEVVLIAKLQHRNLVRLLGCCIHGDEKLLIYEYLPNKSLDFFIFDAASKNTLDWQTRFRIIRGISRGLLYLHQDSRLTIIHRDLKTSNILLDAEMNPKISDFGMARIFGGNQQEANTNRVVGTFGYMSPEYAMDGAFSVKSDTYSFGVILLEIVSGLKITLTRYMGFPNLLAYAWSLWEDDRAIDLVDQSLLESRSTTEALRCIHVGLLCVQDNPNNRPLMSSVVFMLENEATALPVPKQPVYFSQMYPLAQGSGENTSGSVNGMSTTILEGR